MTEKSEQTNIVLVMGRKGTGKTTWLRKCLKNIEGKKTVLLIDTMNNFDGINSREIKTANEFLDIIILNNYHKKIYRLNTTEENEIIKCINLAYQIGNISIFFDEGDSIFHRGMHHSVREVVLRGRNQGTDLLIACLRPFKIHPDLRTQADLLIIFSFKNKRDIQSIHDEFGVQDIEEKIMNLEGHEYIKYQVHSGETTIYRGKRTYKLTGKYSKKRIKKIKNKKEETA